MSPVLMQLCNRSATSYATLKSLLIRSLRYWLRIFFAYLEKAPKEIGEAVTVIHRQGVGVFCNRCAT
jgi:hypothetical protein